MHTLTRPDGWTANFNGDFSGDVRLSNERKAVDVTLPFDVLKALVAEYLRRERVSRLEQASPDELLGLKMGQNTSCDL